MKMVPGIGNVLGLGLVPMIIVMFGIKGTIGFVVGLGLAAVCVAWRNEDEPLPMAIAGGLGGLAVLMADWINLSFPLAREGKLHIFINAGVGLLVVAIVLAILARFGKTTQAEVAK